MAGATYKGAGVDLDVYERSMARLPRLMHRTFSPRVIRNDGGFAGFFQLDFANRLFARNYRDPVLVSCTDGVGTKLRVATLAQRHNTVGIDLVAMSVNDAICSGAEPLFFLDYVAMSQDDPDLLEQIVQGVSDGCVDAGCSLLGGETAIMPDIYAPGDYDLAGFCVAVAERDRLIDGKSIQAGDVVFGLASSGIHSNGYSLVRKVVFDMAGLSIDDYVAELDTTVASALLMPTKIYARPVQLVLDRHVANREIRGIAHITGGGLFGNFERILPEGLHARIGRGSWPEPPVFSWIQKLGRIETDEMERVFNMGIGLVIVVSAAAADSVDTFFREMKMEAFRIGKIEAGLSGVLWNS